MGSMEASNDNGFGSLGTGGMNPRVGSAGTNDVTLMNGSGMMAVGSSAPTNAPISSDNGDIVLGGDGRKSKKWWAIGIIVVVLLVALGIVFIIMNISGGRKETKGLKESFNRFANYTLSGHELDTQIDPEIDLDGNYYLNNNEDNKAEMYSRVEDLFLVFKEQYFRSDISKTAQQSEYYDDIVNAEEDLAVFMSKVYTKDLPSEQDLMASYAINGRDTTIEKFNNYYSLDVLNNNRYAVDFHNHYKEWLDNSLNMLDIYNASGCINDKEIFVACSLTEQQNETITDLVKIIDNNYVALKDSYELSNHFIRMIFIINSLINNESISDYVLLVDDSYYENGEFEK